VFVPVHIFILVYILGVGKEATLPYSAPLYQNALSQEQAL